MSMEATKSQLVRLLEDSGNKVLAVSGKWGTGKTHMWREVRNASKDEKVKNSLYVSLFGLADLAQIKLKIVQSAIMHGDKSVSNIGDTLKAAKKVLASLHSGFSALDELALLAVPKILKDKVIVLDDIERKHEKLSIDEVLGFIDEFTQLHGARFVLVMNSDQLRDKEVWTTLREKVVDQELRLDTSPAEAFGIAVKLTASPYAEQIGKALATCRVTNIRVIRKVIKAVNQVLGGRQNLPSAVLARVVPSTVLLAAINFKGIEHGPDFEYVLSAGNPESILSAPDNEIEDKKERASWKLMLGELGIRSSDEYELLVVEFLQSGLFDVGEVSRVIDRYVAEHEAVEVRNEVNAFLERAVWDHRLTDNDLLTQARGLRSKVRYLDAFFVSALAAEVASIPDGKTVSDDLIEEWLKNLPQDFSWDPDDEFFFRRRMHPKIKEVLSQRSEQILGKTTVFDACLFIAEHSGWGTRQEMVLKTASTEDFEKTIRSLGIADLQRFMRKMLELSASRDAYVVHFGAAVDRFVEASRRIVESEPASRLSRLIRSLFESQRIGNLLMSEQSANLISEQCANDDPTQA